MSDMLARLMALAAMRGADLSDYYTKAETDRHISDEVARIVSDAPEDFDTLRELSDWIATHEESAAAMNSAIQANTAGVAALNTEVATKAPQSTTYTKAEVDTLLTGKADLSIFTPMTQEQYDALVTKTAPLYFIYEDGEST